MVSVLTKLTIPLEVSYIDTFEGFCYSSGKQLNHLVKDWRNSKRKNEP